MCNSRCIYPTVRDAFLDARRALFEMLALERPLSLGNAESLGHEVLQHRPGVRWLVLGLGCAGLIDASGAVALAQLMRQLWRTGVQL